MADLNITQELIDNTREHDTMMPDPNWSFTDGCGHQHKTVGKTTPTVTTRAIPYWCEDCADHHNHYESVCRACSEPIDVPTVVDVARSEWKEWTPGLIDAILTVRIENRTTDWSLPDEGDRQFAATAISAEWPDVDIEQGLGDTAVKISEEIRHD